VACGLIQTLLTYADAGGPEPPPDLAKRAARGQALFRRHNCRACHQVYGFGGFLGPDLTNVASRYSANELEGILTTGRKQMPAFGFTALERRDLYAFFESLDATARSQPHGLRNRAAVDPLRHFQAMTEAYLGGTTLPARAARGLALMNANECGKCHVPLTEGVWRAPDLTLVPNYRTEEWITTTIRTGRDAMPAFKVTAAEAADIADFLRWMAANRDGLQAADEKLCDREPFRWSEVPWFEYR
jgi:mono/diheme cytochrome c family protein